MNQREMMYQRIQRHGEQLNEIFHTELQPVALCKRLRRLEVQASRVMLALANGDAEQDEVDRELDKIEANVNAVLGNSKLNKRVPIFINRDPRGYALKIDDDYVRELRDRGFYFRHRDWRGCGILAPDLTEA